MQNGNFLPKFDPETGRPLETLEEQQRVAAQLQGRVENIEKTAVDMKNEVKDTAEKAEANAQQIPQQAPAAQNFGTQNVPPVQQQPQYQAQRPVQQQPQYQAQRPVQMPPQFVPPQAANGASQKKALFPNYQIDPAVKQTVVPQNAFQQPNVYQYQQNIPAPVYPSAKKGIGITSLVMGILAVVFSFTGFFGVLFGLAGLILGIIGCVKKNGKGMSIAGIVLSIIGIVLSVVVLIAAIEAIKNGAYAIDYFNGFDY